MARNAAVCFRHVLRDKSEALSDGTPPKSERKDTHLVKAMLDQTLPKRGSAGRGASPALAVQRRRARLLARALRKGAIPR